MDQQALDTIAAIEQRDGQIYRWTIAIVLAATVGVAITARVVGSDTG